MQGAKSKFDQLKKTCDEINSLTSSLSKGEITFFETVSISVKFNHAELCFHNLTSWLYILYHEYSAKNIDFIRKKIISYKIPMAENGVQSKQLVHSFRTIFQHQMDYINSKSDAEKRNLCHSWFQETIQKQEPTNDTEWEVCVNKLLDSAIEMIQAMLACLKEIAKSEHLSLVVDEWKKLVFRNYSSYDFEKILIKVLHNLGLSGYFDTNSVVKKNIAVWRNDLDVLPDGFNFDAHAYKIIERFILRKEVIPIDGNDIVSLGVEKGIAIPPLLIKAREIFYSNPCNREQLLLAVKALIK